MPGNNKRKLSDSFTEDEAESKFSKEEDGHGMRPGRARKKSAKVLEMEEFEVELSTSASRGTRSRKKSGKAQESEQVTTANRSPKSPTKSRKKLPISSPQSDIKEEQPDSSHASALKLMLSLPVKAEVPTQPKDENLSVPHVSTETVLKGKSKGKSGSKRPKKAPKQEPAAAAAQTESGEMESLSAEEVKQSEGIPTGMKQEEEILQDEDQPPLIVAEKVKKKRANPKRKKPEQKQQTVAMQPALLNFQPDARVETMDYEAFVQTMEGEEEVKGLKEDVGEPQQDVRQEQEIADEQEVGEEQEVGDEQEVVDEQEVLDPHEDGEDLHGDIDGEAVAIVTQAAAQTKVKGKKKMPTAATGLKGKTLKGKSKKKEDKEDKTPKRRTTAYTLWCNNTRKELMMQYPSLDFAQISKKLAELWQTVSVAEKNTLRKKARKIQKKQNNGEDVNVREAPASTHMRSGQPQVTRKVVVQTDQPVYTSPPVSYNFKVTGNEPIDVAAHLKLLGESLGTIGARLQEHRGHIAVQGSLSVLLDSLICALGPLMCLTNQVPELNSVPSQLHHNTLDNIAYIMPGIG